MVVAAILIGALFAPASAMAYVGGNPPRVRLKVSPARPLCTEIVTITASVSSWLTGRPQADLPLSWSLMPSPSSGDRLSANRTLTDVDGKTSIKLKFGPVRGKRTVVASVYVLLPGDNLSVTCRNARSH